MLSNRNQIHGKRVRRLQFYILFFFPEWENFMPEDMTAGNISQLPMVFYGVLLQDLNYMVTGSRIIINHLLSQTAELIYPVKVPIILPILLITRVLQIIIKRWTYKVPIIWY